MQRRNALVSHLAAVLVAASIVSSPLVAQGSPIGKGTWIIGGTAGVNSQHIDGVDGTVTSVSIDPSALFFVGSGVAVGGSVRFSYFKTGSGSSTTIGVGPSIRYYFGDRAAKTLPFVSATVAPDWTSTDPKNSSATNSSSHGLTLEGTVGFTQLLVPHVGITGEAYYDHLSLDSDAGPLHVTEKAYAIGVRFGVTAFLF